MTSYMDMSKAKKVPNILSKFCLPLLACRTSTTEPLVLNAPWGYMCPILVSQYIDNDT